MPFSDMMTSAPFPDSLPDGMHADSIGVVVVDHGSRRAESNEMLLEVVRLFEKVAGFSIVEPAHMELAEPSIRMAFDRCVQRGATTVVVHPYFLLPGRHWDEDIPALALEAAKDHAEVRYLVTAPLGLHPLMMSVMQQRIMHCLAHTLAGEDPCEACAGTEKCQMRVGAGDDA